MLSLAFIGPDGIHVPDREATRAKAPAIPSAPRTSTAGVSLFEGLGSWVDIYEHWSFADPEGAVRRMANHGVQTLYLETSNFSRQVAIKWPGRERRFIRAAHADGMQIVAWYLPGFLSVRRDFNRVMA